MGMTGPLGDLARFFGVYADKAPEWAGPMTRATVVTLEITALAFALGLGVVVALGRLSKVAAIRRSWCCSSSATGWCRSGSCSTRCRPRSSGSGSARRATSRRSCAPASRPRTRGQREAGLAVGMGPWQVYRFVLLPQAARIALPPLVGAPISVLKDSSLASLISSPDIMLRAKDISSSDFLPLHILLAAGAIYFLLALPLSGLAAGLERRMSRGVRR